MTDDAKLIERLRARAEDEREIQRNNQAVADALASQMEAFERRDGTHNNFAVRLGYQHKRCAENDAQLAADWDDAAARLTALIAENERLRGALQWYANPANWCDSPDWEGPDTSTPSAVPFRIEEELGPMICDCGDTARAALSGDEGGV